MKNILSHYKFNKNIDVTDKYRKGRLDSAEWLSKLVFFFMQKEKNLVIEFKTEIEKEVINLGNLNKGEYKQGLVDGLELIKDIIKKNQK